MSILLLNEDKDPICSRYLRIWVEPDKPIETRRIVYRLTFPPKEVPYEIKGFIDQEKGSSFT